jgi:hypothetical protein
MFNAGESEYSSRGIGLVGIKCSENYYPIMRSDISDCRLELVNPGSDLKKKREGIMCQ